MSLITHARLRELLDYDPATGVFRNRVQRGSRSLVGAIAGSPSGSDRSRHIKIESVVYRSSRLAWLYMTGEWPTYEIERMDRDPMNDRWANLREGTRSEVMRKQRTHKNSKSGLKGAWFDPARGHWIACIMLHRKKITIGTTYASAEEAHAAYREAAKRLFGKFARAE